MSCERHRLPVPGTTAYTVHTGRTDPDPSSLLHSPDSWVKLNYKKIHKGMDLVIFVAINSLGRYPSQFSIRDQRKHFLWRVKSYPAYNEHFDD